MIEAVFDTFSENMGDTAVMDVHALRHITCQVNGYHHEEEWLWNTWSENVMHPIIYEMT